MPVLVSNRKKKHQTLKTLGIAFLAYTNALDPQIKPEPEHRDFNSSSDTYTSENNDEKEVKTEPKQEMQHQDSFERNFDLSDGLFDKSAESKVIKMTIDNDEFSFVQPGDAKPQESDTPKSIKINSPNPFTSPSKSALRKTPNTSPKKNVVFTNSNPQVIHYAQPDSSLNEEDKDAEDKKFSDQVEQTLNHQWGQVRKSSVSSEEETPPVPPPHSKDILDYNYQSNSQDYDKDALHKFKLHLKNLNNLSLNEKLDIFLNTQHQQQQEQGEQKELDQHLQDLDDASKYQVQSNIHHLSLDLQNKLGSKIENPLDSLTKSSDVPLRSAGSSQSSLQSLLENNRELPSTVNEQGSRGIQLNDGIHGFSNDLVEQMIPQSQSQQFTNSDESQLLSFSTNPNRLSRQSLISENEEFHDSFDNEYNNTEQSIMDLLSSASANQNKDQADKNPIVKEEPEEFRGFEEPSIKKSDSMKELEIKQEIGDISNEIAKPTLKPTESDTERESPINDTFDDEDKKESKFRISDHIDDDWKFEDSLDADREDNDELTNYDVTMASQSPEENMIPNDAKVDEGPLEPLDVDLSPDSSRSIEDSPDRVSLAPPRSEASLPPSPVRSLAPPTKRIDIGIDATTPPTPIKKAREARLKSLYGSVSPKEENVEAFDHKEAVSEEKPTAETKEIKGDSVSEEVPLSANVDPVSPTESEKPLTAPSASQIFEDETLVNAKLESPPVVEREESEEPSFEKDESEILANSTNVAPPEELTLPPIETNNYSSFEEITRTLNNSRGEDSFEQSLSAEFDEEKPSKLISYLSIWHSQDKTKPKHVPAKRKSIDVNNISVYDANTNSFKIPSRLLNKKLKDVNVVSRKVVDPNDVDLEVQDFLPELSQDSGFENHFNHLMANESINSQAASGNRLSVTPLSDRNVLANLEKNKSDETLEQQLPFKTLQPSNEKPITKISQKRSKFRVPSIEIKKSFSKAQKSATREKYDDIFHDSVDYEAPNPTIKSQGMKTLPSMDKDDVKKILNTKRMISQEEYSQLKLVGRKSSVVHENTQKYDSLQQEASIHNADVSLDSAPLDDMLPHLKSQLMKEPQALLSKDQLFHDSDLFSNGPGSNVSSRVASAVRPTFTSIADQLFPEPSPDILNSPGSIFKTPPKDEITAVNDKVVSPDKENQPPVNRPAKGKPGSPIKINSPIKLVKKNSGTSVVLQSQNIQSDTNSINHLLAPPRSDTQLNRALGHEQQQFSGNELVNNKLRGKDAAPENNEKKLSIVSVPSMYTNNTAISSPSQPSGVSSQTLLNPNNNRQHTWKQHSVQSSVLRENDEALPLERGRLFFRVVGLKNVQLPQIKEHNAEFSLTLDNGVHCIKTPNYNLDSQRVPIGKEFELTVGESLEFILTMKMNYQKPRGKLVEVHERKIVKSKNRFSRMFGSKDIVTTTKFVPQDSDDPWQHKFAQDGSFGRCYVDLSQYESKITYNTNTFDIPCFNEWEEIQSSSGLIKAKPYVIGQLEVKLLFIPRTELHESLPTSIKSASEVITQLLHEKDLRYEGYLTQDGGDCESLKRRFFKLEGASMIAHSEFSHKTRAKINLSKIIDVIYVDRNRPETAEKARNFSDVLLVPDSFKIKFSNGEVIDFGAPNRHEKLQWIGYLEAIAQHNRYRRLNWVKAMLEEASTKTNNPWLGIERQAS